MSARHALRTLMYGIAFAEHRSQDLVRVLAAPR